MTGYLHPAYADSLSEFGKPYQLKSSGGWILISSINNSLGLSVCDARGVYPLFTCRYWSKINDDLVSLENELISLVMVTDPFGDFNTRDLQSCFPDLFRPYKEHFVIDLSRDPAEFVSCHHKRYVRKARKKVQVEICPEPMTYAQDWCNLYSNLIKRRTIKGISAFSKNSLCKQLQVPGLDMFRAVYKGQSVGIMLIFRLNYVGYYHLSAYNDTGYDNRASFALISFIMEYYASKLRWINLGAGAGIHGNSNDGLTRFKKGWATGTRTAYICGKVFNRPVYDQLSSNYRSQINDYFPIYRKDEVL